MIDPFGGDQNDGRTVQKAIEPVVFAGELGDQDVEDKHREHRNDPIRKGNRRIRHRDACQFRHDQGNHKFKRLQLRKLSFAHQTHDEQKKYISNNRSQKNRKHMDSVRTRALVHSYFGKLVFFGKL